VRITRSPARTASITWLVRLRRSRTPISMCDSVAHCFSCGRSVG
jgi:predicted LPLAT superfamily acyltransferase